MQNQENFLKKKNERKVALCGYLFLSFFSFPFFDELNVIML